MPWYCIANDTQRGPLSLDELRALIREGTLHSDDYVWNESFGEQWRLARHVPELALLPDLPASEPASSPLPGEPTPLTGVPGNRPSFSLALQQAWDHTREILFRHTSFLRWMGMAFCVWISIVGLYEPNLAVEALIQKVQPDQAVLQAQIQSCTAPDQMIALLLNVSEKSKDRVLALLTPERVRVAACAWLALAIVTAWLRARGAFLVMQRWHAPDATLSQSWAAGRRVGWSLFQFRLIFHTLMAMLTVVLWLDLAVRVYAPMLRGAGFAGPMAGRGFLLLLGLSVVLTLWMTVTLLVNHFAIPIMHWRCVGITEAWRVVVEFCNERPGAMTIYLTLYVLLLHLLLAAACCLCCCGRFLFFLPFVNGILLLPATIFVRGLGISFLRQWRPDLERGGKE